MACVRGGTSRVLWVFEPEKLWEREEGVLPWYECLGRISPSPYGRESKGISTSYSTGRIPEVVRLQRRALRRPPHPCEAKIRDENTGERDSQYKKGSP